MSRKYHNLEGLVRDLERAIEADDAPEWKLLSRLDNALQHIEEADVNSDVDVEDDSGDGDSADEIADGPDEVRQQLNLPGTGRVVTEVPRGTSVESMGAAPPVGGACNRPVSYNTGRRDKRRGT